MSKLKNNTRSGARPLMTDESVIEEAAFHIDREREQDSLELLATLHRATKIFPNLRLTQIIYLALSYTNYSYKDFFYVESRKLTDALISVISDYQKKQGPYDRDG